MNKLKILNNYDYVIIGCGISGLYCAYKILTKNPKAKLLILEKNKEIGGRIGKKLFENIPVVIGAGIGRKNKDKLLIELLNKLHIKYREFISNHKVLNQKNDAKQTFYYLKRQYKILLQKHKLKNTLNFKQMCIKILGKTKYNEFKIASGYTDFEKGDIKDFLDYYEFDDNYAKFTGLSIDWNLLKERLYDIIIRNNKNNIILNSNAYKLRFDKETNNYVIFYKSNKQNKLKQSTTQQKQINKQSTKQTIYSKKVIIASTIDTVEKLMPNCSIYKDIKPNSFIRIYAKFADKSIDILKKNIPSTLYVKGYLQKIIPINSNQGVYMLSYADNKNANHLHKIIDKYTTKNTTKNTTNNTTKNTTKKTNKAKLYKYFENLLSKILNLSASNKSLIKITNMTNFYWKIGTHYYLPLKKKYKDRNDFIEKAQHPSKNLFVVGECIALNQGWTNGALQSVENIVNEL